ncbi:MAG TPA: hypothetical protein VK607_18715 [Kofleriaceae bacterium]|nr:hypothetical protein [Kofleriaceae bacterium]
MNRPAGLGRAGFAGLALAAAAAVLAAPRPARADVTAECDFLEISARSGDKPAIDGELKPLEKKLKKPPFSIWNQFKLLAHAHKALAKKKPEAISLKIGSATATLIEIVDKSKVRLTVAMTDAKGKEVANNTATVDAGDYVIYVHPMPGNEGHLLSVTCK